MAKSLACAVLVACSSVAETPPLVTDVGTTESSADARSACQTSASSCPVECAEEKAKSYDLALKCVTKERVVACMPRPTICSTALSLCLFRDGAPYRFTLDCQLQLRDSQWRACTAEEAALLDSPPCP